MTVGKRIIQTGLFFLALIAFGSMISTNAQDEGIWVDCQGEVVLHHLSIRDAQILAKRQARREAIEKVCGIALQSETLVNNFVNAGDFIHAISYGNVVQERNIEWKTETIPSQDSSQPPLIVLRLSMQVRVIPVEDSPDPEFRLSAQANRHVFQSGEEMYFKIQSSKDCYITIFNLAADDSVYVLYPNSIDSEHFIEADILVEIPSAASRKNGYQFKVATLPGQFKHTETITVIGTKHKIPFWDDVVSQNVGTPRIAMTKLSRWLSEIPVSQRAEASFAYSVQSEMSKEM